MRLACAFADIEAASALEAYTETPPGCRRLLRHAMSDMDGTAMEVGERARGVGSTTWTHDVRPQPHPTPSWCHGSCLMHDYSTVTAHYVKGVIYFIIIADTLERGGHVLADEAGCRAYTLNALADLMSVTRNGNTFRHCGRATAASAVGAIRRTECALSSPLCSSRNETRKFPWRRIWSPPPRPLSFRMPQPRFRINYLPGGRPSAML